MKKTSFLILLFLFIFHIPAFSAAKQAEHPLTFNLDVSKYVRVLDFNFDENEQSYSGTINKIKFKADYLLPGDKIVIYCSGKSNIDIKNLEGELFSSNQSYGSFQLINEESKSKSFSAHAEITLDKAMETNASITLVFKSQELSKKPWLQAKTSKIPKAKKEKADKNTEASKEEADKLEKDESSEKAVATTDSDKSKAETKSKSKKAAKGEKTEEKVVKEAEKNADEKAVKESEKNADEKAVKESEAEKIPEAKIEKKDNSAVKEETTNEETKQPAVEEVKASKETEKSQKSKKKIKKGQLPTDIENTIKNTAETTESWYICKVKFKKKVGKLQTGPFSNKDQAILVWIYKGLPENKKYCIAKNYTYITNSPASYFSDAYEAIKKDSESLETKELFDKYFHPHSTEEITVKETDKTVETEASDNKEAEKKEKAESEAESSFFDLSNYEQTEDLYSKYQKEYLQDYAPKKELKLPEETIREKNIKNPNEADNFGCTLLMKAAKNGNNWELKSLLASGADVNLTDQDGWTALMYACRYQENISIVESLINAGAQVKVKNNYALSPLILAATYNGNPEIMKKLLNSYSVSEKEVLQAFVLLLTDNSASDFAKVAKIETFIDKSIPLNTFYNGKTPLMYAAQFSSSTSILDILLQEGAITSIRSTEGKTAFDYAMENNKLKHDDIFWSLNKK